MILILSVLTFCLTYYIYTKLTHTPIPNLPPGPTPWPIVGNILQLDVNAPHETVDKWANQYGQVMSMYWGKQLVVVLSNWEAFKEAFTGQGQAQIFSGRHKSALLEECFGGRVDFLASDGPVWKMQKKQFLTIMKVLTMGRASMEERISIEMGKMVQEVKQKVQGGESVFELKDRIEMATSNVIHAVTVGQTWTEGDPEFQEYIRRKQMFDKYFMKAGFSDFFPILKYFPPLGYFKFVKAFKAIRIYVREKTREQFGQVDKGNSTVVTEYLKLWRNAKGAKDEKYFSEERLFASVTDLYLAGQDTVSVTAQWLLLFLIENPDVQEKMRREILSEVGKQKITWEDRKKLQYTNAVLSEVQRLGNITPWAPFHSTLGDTTLLRYTVPKGTVIVPNLWTLMHDEKYFPLPYEFKPERFLDNNGVFLQKVDGFAPFGLGKRKCLGEILARMELFLFACILVQNFEFSKVSGASYEGLRKFDAIMAPEPYEVMIEIV